MPEYQTLMSHFRELRRRLCDLAGPDVTAFLALSTATPYELFSHQVVKSLVVRFPVKQCFLTRPTLSQGEQQHKKDCLTHRIRE